MFITKSIPDRSLSYFAPRNLRIIQQNCFLYVYVTHKVLAETDPLCSQASKSVKNSK